MKYISSLILVCVLVTCSWFAACTGLENGPAISFVKATTKMANTWKVKEAILNATDITADFEGDFMTFEEDQDFNILDTKRIVSLPPFTQTDTLEVLGRGTWDFLDSNTNIELLYTYNYQDPFDQDILYSQEMYEQWEITRLTEDEFWLRNDSMSIKLELFSAQ